jgi:hypothetical protein
MLLIVNCPQMEGFIERGVKNPVKFVVTRSEFVTNWLQIVLVWVPSWETCASSRHLFLVSESSRDKFLGCS